MKKALWLIMAMFFSLRCFAGGSDGLRVPYTGEAAYSVSFFANGSSGAFAPYMIGSWREGVGAMKSSAAMLASVGTEMPTEGVFGWGARVELMAGWEQGADYDRYEAPTLMWHEQRMRPAAVTVRNCYGEAHYRAVKLRLGAKTHRGWIVAEGMSSGDLILSDNARPIPGVAIGFTDFQDIPLTHGWVQMNAEVMYGKFFDDAFRRKQFNYYNQLLATGLYYTYKYCYFRTKPTERLVATFGMQAAGQFGGRTEYYYKGHLRYEENRGFKFSDAMKMLVPTRDNGNGFYEGNSLGTWSLRADYRFGNERGLAFYWEKPFEDGSGIACRNGADALYGLHYRHGRRGWFTEAVAEYLDLRNQSGPIHYAPGDRVDPSISTEATGADNYFNNDTYGAYANYGMGIGTPMVVSPLYNENGFPLVIYNRMRGTHLAVAGRPGDRVGYKVAFSWQKGYSNGRVQIARPKSDVSGMVEAWVRPLRRCNAVELNCRVAFDRGELRGNNFGVALGVTYNGLIGGK